MKFEKVPVHAGIKEAGNVAYWDGSDSIEAFKENIQDKKKLFYLYDKKWNEENAIEYRLNSYGFRTDEFGTEPCVMTLGCSHTYGTGLPEQDTWARYVANETGLKLANFGWPGSSADTAYRFLRYWINHLNVKLVCFLLPPAARFELLLDSIYFKETGQTVPVNTYSPNDLADTWLPDEFVLNNWFGNEENAVINQEKNKLAVQQLCANKGVPCLIEDSLFLAKREPNDWARDFLHAGPAIHKKLGKKFINDWNELKTRTNAG
jgi:hypothetical protein